MPSSVTPISGNDQEKVPVVANDGSSSVDPLARAGNRGAVRIGDRYRQEALLLDPGDGVREPDRSLPRAHPKDGDGTQVESEVHEGGTEERRVLNERVDAREVDSDLVPR